MALYQVSPVPLEYDLAHLKPIPLQQVTPSEGWKTWLLGPCLRVQWAGKKHLALDWSLSLGTMEPMSLWFGHGGQTELFKLPSQHLCLLWHDKVPRQADYTYLGTGTFRDWNRHLVAALAC